MPTLKPILFCGLIAAMASCDRKPSPTGGLLEISLARLDTGPVAQTSSFEAVYHNRSDHELVLDPEIVSISTLSLLIRDRDGVKVPPMPPPIPHPLRSQDYVRVPAGGVHTVKLSFPIHLPFRDSNGPYTAQVCYSAEGSKSAETVVTSVSACSNEITLTP